MKAINENYTSVCWYCGVIFRSNRPDAKHCSSKHRSLRGKHGPRINSMVKDGDGKYFYSDESLNDAYEYHSIICEDGWSKGYTEAFFNNEFDYYGPFPKGSRTVVIGSFLLKMHEWCDLFQFCINHYFVKPIDLLITDEKAIGFFFSAEEEERGDNLHYSPRELNDEPLKGNSDSGDENGDMGYSAEEERERKIKENYRKY